MCRESVEKGIDDMDATAKKELSSFPNYSYAAYDSLDEIYEIWKTIIPENLFFEYNFLKCIESDPPKDLHGKYLLFWHGEKAVGIGVAQIKLIQLRESLRTDPNVSGSMAAKTGDAIKSVLSKCFKLETLICGNVLLTGKYGFHFNNELDYPSQFVLITESLNDLRSQLVKEGRKMGPILMKDFDIAEGFTKYPELKTSTSFNQFEVQPNMMVYMRPNWKQFSDYLADCKSKYRMRAKRAFKKLGTDITKKTMDVAQLKIHEKQMHQMYMETADKAGFNLFTLPVSYFTNLKEYLKDQIKIVGYFEEDKLIAYYTIIFNYDFAEAHFLGYDKQLNADKQLYLNMLYAMVKETIDANLPKLQLARTALEIKSSVGAIPEELSLYLKLNGKITNALIPSFLKFFVPKEEWLPRSPFKD